jgi:hypothetical protein
MAQGGLLFEVELAYPTGTEWDLIIRCVGTLPDNFAVQTGPMPRFFEHASINGQRIVRCQALNDTTPDRFGRPRVDMVGVLLAGESDRTGFVAGQRVAMMRNAASPRGGDTAV